MPLDSIARPHSVPAALTAAGRKRANGFGNLRTETLLRKLEPRIMFDAAAVATAADVLHHDVTADASHPADAAHADHAGTDLAALGPHMHGPVVIQGDATAKSVVFIDANVQDPQAIEKAVASNAEIVLLDANQDGLLQIANFLQGRTGLDSIHIVSHGAQGELSLGNAVVTAASLAGADTELDAIGAALRAGGDILLYGCDVAQGASGDAFVHQFAALTHANIAASTDTTGADSHGGNWVLEDQVGSVHTTAIQAAQWNHELTTNTVATAADLIIAVNGSPDVVVNNNTGVGSSALWHNAGTFNGAHFDLKATVTGGNGTIDFAPNLTTFTNNGYSPNDPTLIVTSANSSVTVKWEVFAAGTNQTVPILGNAHLSVGDIDGTDYGESVAFDKSAVSSYRLNTATVLTMFDNGTTLKAAATTAFNTNNLPNQRAMYDLDGVSSWNITYTSVITGRGYVMDGDFQTVGDTTVITEVHRPLVDLNAFATSTAANLDYAATFTEGSAPVAVAGPAASLNDRGEHDVTSLAIIAAGFHDGTSDHVAIAGKTFDLATDATQSATVGGTAVSIHYVAATGAFTITEASGGVMAQGDLDTLIKGVTYENVSQNPTAGHATLTFSATDSTGLTSPDAIATVTVVPVNDAPVEVVPGAQVTDANTALALTGLLVSDVDANGGLETVTLSVAHGTLTLSTHSGLTFTTGDGTADPTMVFKGTLADINTAIAGLSYAPTLNYNGADTLTFTTNDNANTGTGGAQSSGAHTVAISVVAPPNAVDDAFFTTLGTPIKVSVLSNDTDIYSYPLTVTQVDGHAITAGDPVGVPVTGGAVTLDATGKLTYTPDAGYLGTPTFTYTVNDGHGQTDTATVNGSVTPLNHAPVNIVPGTQEVAGGTLVLSTANGNAVQVTDDASATQIIQTTVSVDSGSLTLKQVTGLTFLTGDGTADPTISIQGTKAAINAALDGMKFTAVNGSTSAAHLTIKTDDLGHPNGEDIPNGGFETTLLPVPAGGQLTMLESNVPGWKTTATDHMIEIWGSGFLGVPAYEGIHFAELNANQVAADYNTSTIPKGQPLTFSFAHRGRAGVDVMNVTVIDAGADGVFGTADDTTLMNQNYSDGTAAWGAYSKDLGTASGNPVRLVFNSVSSVGGPSLGNFLDAVHLGTAHLTDSDTFVLQPGPVAINDTFTTAAGASAVIHPLTNDTDPAGFPLAVTKLNGADISIGSPVTVTGGTVTLDASNLLTYVPNAGYAGTPTFTYTVDDAHGGTATAAVNGTVWAPPVAANDTFATAAGANAVFHPLANDTDPNAGFTLKVAGINGAPVTVGTPVALPDGSGTVTVDASGNMTFAPTTGYAGTPSFTYTVNDGHGGIATATVNGTVWAPPALTDDTFHTTKGVAVTVDALANDSDPNAFPLTISKVNGAAIASGGSVAIDHGSVALTAGKLVFTPAAGYTGAEAFTYTVSDGHGGTATANVTGSIFPPPVALADGFATAAGVADTIPVLANDSDPNAGFTFGITAVNGQAIIADGPAVAVTGGTVALDDNGNLVFTPNAGYSGHPSFTYTITDDHGGTATAAVNGIVYAPPAATNDTFGSGQGVATAIPVLTNDTDANGFALTVAAVNGTPIAAGDAPIAVANGTVALTAPGVLTFTPNTGYNGPAGFNYTVTDGHGGSATATVNGTVYAPPAAMNDTFASAKGATATINALANDTDPNGFALAITAVNGTPVVANGPGVIVPGGTVALDALGNLDFFPNAGFVGQTSFQYTVADGHGGTGVANITGIVYGPPVAAPDTFTTLAGLPATIAVLANDSDPNGLALTISKVNGAAITLGGLPVATSHGSVALTAAGLVYTPNAGYNGPESFTYAITDGHGSPSTATVTGHVVLPPAVDLSATLAGTGYAATFTEKGAPVAIAGADATLTDTNAATLQSATVTLTDLQAGDALMVGTLPAGITASLDTSVPGQLTVKLTGADTVAHYQAALQAINFSNSSNNPSSVDRIVAVSFDDGANTSNTAIATIYVVPVNDAPVETAPMAATTLAGIPVAIAGLSVSDVDANGGLETVTLSAANGTVTLGSTFGLSFALGAGNGGGTVTFTGTLAAVNAAVVSTTYTPNAGYAGTDTVTFTTNDNGNTGAGGPMTSTHSVAVTVLAPPVASNDTVSGNEDTGITVDVLANDHVGFNVTGALTITAINGQGLSVGGAPVAVANGTVALGTDGKLTFTPDANYNGAASFGYAITDSIGQTANATVQINVTSVNDAPVAANATITTLEDTPYTFKPADFGFADPNDAPANALANVIIDTLPAHGTLTLNGAPVTANQVIAAADIPNLVFTPAANANGNGLASFTFQVEDNGGTANGGHDTSATPNTIAFNVTPVNDAPVAANATITTLEDTPYTFKPADFGFADPNDSPANALANLIIDTLPAHGTLTLNGAPVTANQVIAAADIPNLVFTPAANANGNGLASFTFQVEDNGGTANGGHDTSATPNTIAFNVTPVNDAPVEIAPGPGAIAAGATLGLPGLSVSDVDANGGLETVTLSVGHGTVSLGSIAGLDFAPGAGNGKASVIVTGTLANINAAIAGLTYTPNAGYAGADTLGFATSDNGNSGLGGPLSTTQAVGLTVWAPPAPQADSFATAAGAPVTITPLSNDTDPNGFSLTIAGVNGAPIVAGTPVAVAGGSVVIDALGNLTFTPNAGYAGTPSFTYTVDDDHGGRATATVSGVVYAPPAVKPDVFATGGGIAVRIPVLANDTDPNAFPLTVTQIDMMPVSIGGPPVAVTGGTVTLDSAGNPVFTPAVGFVGAPSFSYTVSDGHGGSATAQVSGTVNAPVAIVDDAAVNGTLHPVSGNVLANDHDSGPTPLPLSVVNIHDNNGVSHAPGTQFITPLGALLTINADGTYTYIPTPALYQAIKQHSAPGHTVNDMMVYSVGDGTGAVAMVKANFNVANVPPVVQPDVFATAAGKPVVIHPLGNDSDPSGLPLIVSQVNGHPITAGTPVPVAGGTVTLDNLGNLTFKPDAAYAGTPSFTYTASDNYGGTATASVSGTVYAAPVLTADSFAIAAGKPVVIAPLANDTDPNGFALTITAIDGHAIVIGTPVAVTGGTVTLDPAGNLTFMPAPGFAGKPSFTYTASDGHGGQASATVNGTVWAPPTPQADSFRAVAGNPAVISPLANDSDPNGFKLTVAAIDGHAIAAGGAPVAVEGGSVALDSEGHLIFTPAPGYSGTPSFTYTVSDGHGGIATATIAGKVAAGLNLAQHETAGASLANGNDQAPVTADANAGGAVDEYVHKVAGGDKTDLAPAGDGEHIRIVVEGTQHKLNQQYGAGGAGVPMSSTLGTGHEESSEGSELAGPSSDGEFWHNLAPLDFGTVHGHLADLGGPTADHAWREDLRSPVWLEAQAVPFSDQMARIRGRFDRSALQLGADLAQVA